MSYDDIVSKRLGGAMSVMNKVKDYASSLGESAQVTIKKVSDSVRRPVASP